MGPSALLGLVLAGAAASPLVLGLGRSVTGCGNGGMCQGWGWCSASWGQVPGFLSYFFFLSSFFFFIFRFHISDRSYSIFYLAYFL